MNRMSVKKEAIRERQEWRAYTRRTLWSLLHSCPEDIKTAVMWDLDDDKLNDVAIHCDERLITDTLQAIIDNAQRRKKVILALGRIIGKNEQMSEIDLFWALRYGGEMFRKAASDAFAEERSRVFNRMNTNTGPSRMLAALQSLPSETEQREQNLDD